MAVQGLGEERDGLSGWLFFAVWGASLQRGGEMMWSSRSVVVASQEKSQLPFLTHPALS